MAKKQKEETEGVEVAPLPSLSEALAWGGRRVDGLGGRSLGRVVGIHVDAEDGEPRWVVIRLGPFTGSTAIPFEHVAEGAGRLWAAYDRDWVREAPRFRPSEPLTREQEIELCAHWGIREGKGRAGEVDGSEPGELTALPAADRG